VSTTGKGMMKFNLSLFALLTFMNPIVPYSDSSEDEMEEVVEASVEAKTTQETQTDRVRKIEHVAVLTGFNLVYSTGIPRAISTEPIIRKLQHDLNARHEPVDASRIRVMQATQRNYQAVIQPGTGHAILIVGNKRYRFTNNAYVKMLQDEERRIISQLNYWHEREIVFLAEANRLKTLILRKNQIDPLSPAMLVENFVQQIDHIREIQKNISKSISELQDIQSMYKQSEKIMTKQYEFNFLHCFDDHFLILVNDNRKFLSLYGNQFYSHEESVYAIKLYKNDHSRKEVLYFSEVVCMENYVISCIAYENKNKVVKQPRRFFPEYFEDLDPSVVRDYPECISDPESESDWDSNSAAHEPVTSSPKDYGDMEGVDDAQESEVESPEDYGEMEEVDDL